ncbi:hypothetical protein T11_9524 [Trichinella zimbabwensis]|uniref:Uncharacterized protein n=1 Tax=Trichinella zimbabwensis TaxID=268475 RepID=A0A0V1H0W8_9BILA|nr:hypothetical protein T11_9524 [Trichinella zimbabwensis]
MKISGFTMKKWAINYPAALADLPAQVMSPVEKGRLQKTLGLYWYRRNDTLTFVPLAEIFSE